MASLKPTRTRATRTAAPDARVPAHDAREAVVPARGAPAAPARRLRILSSAHLADGPASELSEFEFGLIVAHNAFTRWATRCMAAAGMPELAITDILVLHHVRHRDRPKKLSDVCFTLNYEDTHVVSYALRKLVGLGLLESSRQGKEVLYATTEAGRALVERYRELRGACLLPSVTGDLGDVRTLADTAQLLRALSGLYDQAARAAASL
ncbi:MAG: transcriptional regulator [Burkholderiales bacterium]|nr:MAG: transcriptional regulator [Burkholderiales bacterium]